MFKTINPKETYFWSPEECPDTVFEYRAYTGPLIPPTTIPEEALVYTIKAYLNHCLVSVTNIEIPVTENGETVMRPFEKWDGRPKVNWATILPWKTQNKLGMLISDITRLDGAEARDLS